MVTVENKGWYGVNCIFMVQEWDRQKGNKPYSSKKDGKFYK